MGRLLGTLEPQAVPQHYIELWIQPFCGGIGAPSCRETERLKAHENGSGGEVCASRSLPGDGKKTKQNKNQKNMDDTIVPQRVLETGMGSTQGTLQDSPEGLETSSHWPNEPVLLLPAPAKEPQGRDIRTWELYPGGSRGGLG